MISALLVALTLLLSPTADTQVRAVSVGGLELSQIFGRALYRRCDLGVYFAQGPTANAWLWCVFNHESPAPEISTRRELSPVEAKDLADLVNPSDLYGSGNTGGDSRPVDGVIEILTVSCCGRSDTVALVVSGNETFAKPGSRRQLLDRLHALLRELQQEAYANYQRAAK